MQKQDTTAYRKMHLCGEIGLVMFKISGSNLLFQYSVCMNCHDKYISND